MASRMIENPSPQDGNDWPSMPGEDTEWDYEPVFSMWPVHETCWPWQVSFSFIFFSSFFLFLFSATYSKTETVMTYCLPMRPRSAMSLPILSKMFMRRTKRSHSAH